MRIGINMKFFNKRDLVIIAVLLLAAAGLYFVNSNSNKDTPAVAEIYYKSDLVKTVSLDEGTDQIFTVPENDHVKFHLSEDGSISFEESDCADQICIHAGELKRVGQSAACLPNDLILKIVPADNNYNETDTDLIVR